VKRITKIEIENYRAFFGHTPIELPKGENLLVYGENGSGKSSLFKALNNYLSSSRNTALTFAKNHYSPAPDGKIGITFQDFDNVTFEPVPGSDQTLAFGSAASTNSVQFIKDGDLIKGFLDYRSLLEVYYYKEPNPNLFELILFTLLGEHIPVGGNYRFREKWNQLQADLIGNSYTRNDWAHRSALAELPTYHNFLNETLNRVFVELNRLLTTYFPQLRIQLGFTLQDLTFTYGHKWQWKTTKDLRLQVRKDGQPVADYSDVLNEARLSAFALCMYLASLKTNPEAFDLKILFLDDVFVGLDTSNRIPILDILKSEFSEYQIFISTYDRHWYELARRKFEIETPNKWLSYEFYVGKGVVGVQEFDKPILVKGESYYEKAVQFLHHTSKPDYPAAANYFRKELEEIIKRYVPKYETVDSQSIQIPEHKLTGLVFATKNFLRKTNNIETHINGIAGLLRDLLHPLSHHQISSPIYKRELELLQTAIPLLKQQLTLLDHKVNFKCMLESNSRLRFTFRFSNVPMRTFYFEIKLEENLIKENVGAGLPSLSLSSCRTLKCTEVNNGTSTSFSPNKNDIRFHYNSLNHAYTTVYNHLVKQFGAFPVEANYLDAIEFLDANRIFQPIATIMPW
jgi:hypothetical protein